MNAAAQAGSRGEQAAALALARDGYKILARNFRTRQGEIDLIAEKDGFVVFVEVKTRAGVRFGQACEAVDGRKQQCILAAAQAWLMQYPTKLQPRFDVMEVYWPRGAAHPRQIRLIQNAFET